MEKKNPVEEARRYVENAKTLLVEHGELDVETHSYNDRKYVRMAGNTLWNGVLLILDAVFHVRKDRRLRVDIEDYRKAVGPRDKKLLRLVNLAYVQMHIYLGYDGSQDKALCDSCFRIANEIIDRCDVMLPKAIA
ncbi:MAG: DUF5618 family protein [Bacteroidales bacterium]|nr:DUF5618 family protein [Bacteroidales bacterium]